MAKKSKSKPAAKRMGATALLNPANPIVQYGSIAAGFFLGDKINPLIDKATGNLDQKIVAGGQVGLGFLLAYKKGKKNIATTVIGGIMIGSGAKRAMTAFGIAGFSNVPAVNGFYDVKAVAGKTAPKRVGTYTPGGGGMSYNTRGSMNGSGILNTGSSMMQ